MTSLPWQQRCKLPKAKHHRASTFFHYTYRAATLGYNRRFPIPDSRFPTHPNISPVSNQR
ncbi:hypothetical protein [Xanthomonas sp. BRIP62411]|uniref:hypothetical protein n=1 Tax=Xanthomonas sp. BRIP62411 TaxID=2182389 RepID=UPI000F8D74EB|nr:hypothetical protein [Xanthomonas sp. BRIP62411]